MGQVSEVRLWLAVKWLTLRVTAVDHTAAAGTHSGLARLACAPACTTIHAVLRIRIIIPPDPDWQRWLMDPNSTEQDWKRVTNLCLNSTLLMYSDI
jgi:hypothetical protein